MDHSVKRRVRIEYKGSARGDGESYNNYRARRWADKQINRIQLSGKMVHSSKRFRQEEPGVTYRENM